jgi:hypothetical protein
MHGACCGPAAPFGLMRVKPFEAAGAYQGSEQALPPAARKPSFIA